MEKKLLTCNMNGTKMVYTAEINNTNHIGQTNFDNKYLHIKCTISNDKIAKYIYYENVYALEIIGLDTSDNIKGFIHEVVSDMDIHYHKNEFIESLTKVIEEYKSKNLNFSKLEEYFDNNIHIHHLCNKFAHMEFNTVLAIYPYYYNKGYNLHVKLTYSCTKWEDTFEYKINSLVPPNKMCNYGYEKVALDILRLIYNKGHVNPVISTFDTVFDMVKYCFDHDLFKDIEKIEKEEN